MFKQKKKGFTTVEILVAVGLVAILMVVAVPRLLDSRKTVSDSSAKQQLNTVMLAVNNWFAERDTFTNLTEAELQARVPEIDIVAAGTHPTKATNGRALTVSYRNESATAVVISASNGEGNCWAIRISTTGTSYYGRKIATCSAGSMPGAASSEWRSFEFPNIDEAS